MKATIYYEIATTNGPATYFSTELTEQLNNDTDMKSMWANFFIEVRLELTITLDQHVGSLQPDRQVTGE